MPRAKKTTKAGKPKTEPKVTTRGLSALEKARKAQKAAKDATMQARVDKALESPRINPEAARQLVYIQKQMKRQRELADLTLLSQRRTELLRDAERVS